MSELQTLTKKHRLFVEAYSGDVCTAMMAAGFVGNAGWLKQEGDKLLANAIIMEAIKSRSKYMAKTFQVIADREERQATLTAIMRNEDPHYKEEKDAAGIPIPPASIPIPTRLKALELLGKSEGDFSENVNIKMEHTLSELVMASYNVTRSTEDIEADYYAAKENQALPEAPVSPFPEEKTSSLEDFL